MELARFKALAVLVLVVVLVVCADGKVLLYFVRFVCSSFDDLRCGACWCDWCQLTRSLPQPVPTVLFETGIA